MKTKVTEKGKWERELEVEVPAERIEAAVARAVKDYQRRLEIPGFRKGKVPLTLVERRYGEAIRQSVISEKLPELMGEAAQTENLVPVAPPRITKLDYQPGQPLSFTATLDIWPEVQVESYDQLKAARLVHTVSDEEIDRQLHELRERHATEEQVDRPLEKGDVLIADLQRLDEAGLPIVGERYEERYFIIGSENVPSPQFEEVLLGIRAGEDRQVYFSYRDDLPDKELAGRQERFGVQARQVRQRTLPALDDEFAKTVGEPFQTLAELRQHLGQQLQRQWDYLARQRLRSDLVSELIKKNPFDLPASLVDNYLESLHRRDHDHQHHDHDHQHEHNHDHQHEHSEEERTFAMRRLKTFLLIEGLRKQTGIEVSDDEFETFLQRRAEEHSLDLETIKRSPRLDDLRQELLEDKVYDFLAQRAEFEEQAV
ncbi:MAG: trigger factor [Candidatus Latescibacteria bacterium]|nr:trigger factor [Candidatus Latescibacterota bacterium]